MGLHVVPLTNDACAPFNPERTAERCPIAGGTIFKINIFSLPPFAASYVLFHCVCTRVCVCARIESHSHSHLSRVLENENIQTPGQTANMCTDQRGSFMLPRHDMWHVHAVYAANENVRDQPIAIIFSFHLAEGLVGGKGGVGIGIALQNVCVVQGPLEIDPVSGGLLVFCSAFFFCLLHQSVQLNPVPSETLGSCGEKVDQTIRQEQTSPCSTFNCNCRLARW